MSEEIRSLLLYWIEERWKVHVRKELGMQRPWSDDPIFQVTYFCNVHRENDRVTEWIRSFYSPYCLHPMFEYNILFSRFINWPETLNEVGYLHTHSPGYVEKVLNQIASSQKKVWGGAYVITTHGIPMPKVQYLTQNVLGSAFASLESLRTACRGTSCHAAAQALQGIEGVGSFLSAQVAADLKNTPGHPLFNAEDKRTFVQPGPGSIRGLGWWLAGDPKKANATTFANSFQRVRAYVDTNWPEEVPPVDNQDLQNCLCEFDKYMRVRTGTGRSKRTYNGAP